MKKMYVMLGLILSLALIACERREEDKTASTPPNGSYAVHPNGNGNHCYQGQGAYNNCLRCPGLSNYLNNTQINVIYNYNGMDVKCRFNSYCWTGWSCRTPYGYSYCAYF